LSRGAARATFIERDRAAIDLLRANAERLGEGPRSHVIYGDATRPPPTARAVDIAFLDPPYGEGLAPLALVALADAGWLAPVSVAMVDTAAAVGVTAPAGFRLIDERRYGKAAITFLVRE